MNKWMNKQIKWIFYLTSVAKVLNKIKEESNLYIKLFSVERFTTLQIFIS